MSDPKHYNGNPYLDRLTDQSFQGVNRLFVLSFGNDAGKKNPHKIYLPKVKLKDYDIKIDGSYFFSQPINNNNKTY